MFKKLKDKLAEEVKSSPQRFQQFAQAAQAAVTSASSSISDITNNDLFSIGDSDGQQPRSTSSLMKSTPTNTFQDVTLIQPSTMEPHTGTDDFLTNPDIIESQRQRRLSNSSFASDVSFRLPSYESPSMYHLQSDMEVSASEAEERGIPGGAISLDRVTKEQIYTAYRRTQDRYTKYRTQYADLARHYKLLERENAKARSVLVETQDKALRRISELREQCTLEQSAKAHLEKALRFEIEEKNMKIDALSTQIKLLQNNDQISNQENDSKTENHNNARSTENHQSKEEAILEIINLNNKIEKFEQLVNKYKESLKTTKEKNAQITTELKMLSSEIENKNKEIDHLKTTTTELIEARQKIQELNELNEELQNKINVFDFKQSKETSALEIDLQKSHEEIAELRNKIEVFVKREEENAISLAENKLSIHKELESKESEIKSLKDSLAASVKEIQSLNIVINDYKNNVEILEEQRTKINTDINEINQSKAKITELELQLQELLQKCQNLENYKTKANEEYKCLQLQLKQETAEKLAMIDRNVYLENRNTQLIEENSKKSHQINNLDKKLQALDSETNHNEVSDQSKLLEEIDIWKSKYHDLEKEIQEERVELVKLQSEIEKLIANHELIQMQNTELNSITTELKSENTKLKDKMIEFQNVKICFKTIACEVKDLQRIMSLASEDAKLLKHATNMISTLKEEIGVILSNVSNKDETLQKKYNELKKDFSLTQTELNKISEKYSTIDNKASSLEAENIELKTKFQSYKLENVEMKDKTASITIEYENSLKELKSMKEEQINLLNKSKKYKDEVEHLRNILNNEKEKVMRIANDNKKYIADIKNMEQTNLTLTAEMEKLKSEYDITIFKFKDIKEEFEILQDKYNEIYDENQRLRIENKSLLNKDNNDVAKVNALVKEKEAIKTEMEILIAQLKECTGAKDREVQEHNDSITKFKVLEEEYTTMMNKYDNVNSELLTFKTEYEVAVNKLDETMTRVRELNHENESLSNTNNSILLKLDSVTREHEILSNEAKESKVIQNELISSLEGNIKNLTQENELLKSQCEIIANNVKDLEEELNVVRKSHVEIEDEKNHLNLIIEQLEKNENNKREQHLCDSCVCGDLIKKNDVTSKVHILDSENNKGISEEHNALILQHNILKEENRRLQSDISGLQTYLTKISKENSDLSDKLRELIASSEQSSDKHNRLNLNNYSDLKNNKIDDLLRENTLLVEENLELKDQLRNSQNYVKNTDSHIHDKESELDNNNLIEKYHNVLEANKMNEKRVLELEQLNKSMNGSVQQVQENNEKLRLTNEKLARRLDEALVSLRHLHSLEENTELEYLRNILYEYLTGSGTHSLTLAKVLAAVVKFDDSQTKQVLIKEKERQGLLRQLGII